MDWLFISLVFLTGVEVGMAALSVMLDKYKPAFYFTVSSIFLLLCTLLSLN